MISPISNSTSVYTNAGVYTPFTSAPASQTGDGITKNAGESDVKNVGRASSPADCQTCKERKYQDGSDEMVSFKAAAHISPNAAPSAVLSHEQEHVSNAYKKAAQGDGKVLQASVRLKSAVCPECGRSYIAGGETTTKIRYSNEKNPYQKALKKAQESILSGMNFDKAI